jgi:hypothetical protein
MATRGAQIELPRFETSMRAPMKRRSEAVSSAAPPGRPEMLTDEWSAAAEALAISVRSFITP